MDEITLQINLSPGDISIAEKTVPHLVGTHKEYIKNSILIVDCNKPQVTKIVAPEDRFPNHKFVKDVEKIKAIAKRFKANGLVDEIYIIEENDPILDAINKKYMSSLLEGTHDYGGCALVSYLAAFELVQTRYLLHFDADMMIYQSSEYSWLSEAIEMFNVHPEYAAITPRLSPPPDTDLFPTNYDWPKSKKVSFGWEDFWFSTRCFLFDREKLVSNLPLLKGKEYLRAIVRKSLKRGFPFSPEVMISNRMKQLGYSHFQLDSKNAWLLHPVTKSEWYKGHLNDIIVKIEKGDTPHQQFGCPDLLEESWKGFVKE